MGPGYFFVDVTYGMGSIPICTRVLVLIPYPQFPIKQLVPFLSDNVPLLEMECEKSDYDDDGDVFLAEDI